MAIALSNQKFGDCCKRNLLPFEAGSSDLWIICWPGVFVLEKCNKFHLEADGIRDSWIPYKTRLWEKVQDVIKNADLVALCKP